MNNIFKIKSLVPKLITSVVVVLFLGSCTIYKYPDRANEDGIYSSGTYRSQSEDFAETNNYYKQYFHSKQGAYSELLTDTNQNESVIFTDVEAYHTNEYVGEDGYIYSESVPVQEESYAGWGNNATSVNINLYSHGGYGYGGYYNSFYGHWGYPYYAYSYYPRWRSGFSWWYGWNGFYSPFYNYYPSYHYGNYYRPSYSNVAYNRGRRNSDYIGRTTSATTATRGRSAVESNGQRGINNGVSRRESTATDNNLRRSSSINNNVRRSTTQTMQRESTTPPRRVTFPQQSNQNRISPRTQPTRRQTPMNNRVQQRPTQSPTRTNPTRQPNRSPSSMRPSSPTRSSSPAMRSSSPTRSSAPASRGRSGGRR